MEGSADILVYEGDCTLLKLPCSYSLPYILNTWRMSVYTELNLGDMSINASDIFGLKSTRKFLKL